MNLDSFVLLSANNGHVVGVLPSIDNSEHAIITVQTQGVYLYNIYDQKCVDSWLFGPGTNFTVPAVKTITKTFLAVQDQKVLIQWEENDKSMKKKIRKTFPEQGNIHSIIVDAKLGNNFVLVFDNGTVALSSTTSQELTNVFNVPYIVPNSCVVKSVSFSKLTTNDIGVFVLAASKSPSSIELDQNQSQNNSNDANTKESASNETNPVLSKINEADGNYSLHVFRAIHSAHDGAMLKKVAEHHLPTSSPRSGSIISASTFDCSLFSLTCLWNDGLIEFYKFEGGRDSLSLPGSLKITRSHPLNVYELPHLVQQSKKAQSSKKSKHSNETEASSVAFVASHPATYPTGIAMTTIQEGYVMIVGPVSGSSSSDSDRGVNHSKKLQTVWDTKFGLVHSHKEIDLDSLTTNQRTTSQLPSIEENATPKASKKKSDSSHAARTLESALPIYTSRQLVPSTDKNVVLINFGQLVMACPIFVAPSSLAQALGGFSQTAPFLKSNQSDLSTSAQFDFMSHSHAPLKALGQNAGFVKVDKAQFEQVTGTYAQAEAHTIELLSDKSKTPDYKSFMEVFNTFVSKLEANKAFVQIEENDSSASKAHSRTNKSKKWKNLQEYAQQENSRKKKAIMDVSAQQSIDFSASFVEKVVPRCLEEDFLSLPLRKLLESKCISLKTIPTLLSSLMKKNRLELVAGVLHNVQDISELELIKIVKWLINEVDEGSLQIFIEEYFAMKKSQQQMDVDEQVDNKDMSWQTPCERYLNAIVSLPINPMFLQYCVKMLTLKEINVFLKYILNWFEHSSEIQEAETEQENYFRVPSLGKVVAWANSIIDSHLSELILVPECGRILRRIQAAINENIELCDGLQMLHGCLINYFDHDPTPRDSISDYSIELLRL